MKPQRVTADGCNAKYTNLCQFTYVGFAVVQEFFPKETVEAGHIDIQSGHYLRFHTSPALEYCCEIYNLVTNFATNLFGNALPKA